MNRAFSLNSWTSFQGAGQDHLDVGRNLNGLALRYYHKGQYAQAEPLFKRAMAIAENALGPDHLELARVLENLATLYRSLKRNGEAERLEQRAARIRAIQR